ncbi:hypothetical protein AGR1C_Lc20284 [Agrobacterium fabacearum TT111]|nr:hypothetical protein AGR1C_Lc20284 [Agrobacterium fabacearum TT111]
MLCGLRIVSDPFFAGRDDGTKSRWCGFARREVDIFTVAAQYVPWSTCVYNDVFLLITFFIQL